ncbi:hypothetical protein M0Q28_02130 [Patescibacteria group bacterium]|jgi:hypothetical protein|nr:hypothetical protein [Patescibacteria group bacterium]
MSEFPSVEAAPKSEQEKLEEFLHLEKEERRAALRKGFLELDAIAPGKPGSRERKLKEIEEMSDQGLSEVLYNNLHCWLPSNDPSSSFGMYRSQGAHGVEKVGSKWTPEKIERKKQIERDVDEFLRTTHSEEVTSRVGKRFGKSRTPEEMQEQWDLLGKLYYFMRQKGYSRKELTT